MKLHTLVADLLQVRSRGPHRWAQLYETALPRANRLLLTEIDRDFDGDAFMPAPDPRVWREVARDAHTADGDPPFGFAYVTYERR